MNNSNQPVNLLSDHEDLLQEGKYLTFTLAQEDYGIDIVKVKEINGMINITPIPQTPDYVKGIINLRGRIIPVIDLRLKFGMESVEYDERTCIIVVEVSGANDESIAIGIIVDYVNDVTNIKQEQMEKTPAFGVSLDTDFIMGMAKVNDSVKILLDIDKVLSGQEMASLNAAL